MMEVVGKVAAKSEKDVTVVVHPNMERDELEVKLYLHNYGESPHEGIELDADQLGAWVKQKKIVEVEKYLGVTSSFVGKPRVVPKGIASWQTTTIASTGTGWKIMNGKVIRVP